MLKNILILAVVFLCPLLQANWKWKLNGKNYQKMNMFQRAQYDKAAKMFNDKNYKGATSEFAKFKVQFPDSDVIPHILFMRAHSLHKSKTRNKAIKLYLEVLDFFGEEIEAAAPALFYMAVAHIENGDTLKGMKLMKAMADDKDYQTHSLAAGAIRSLADNHWKNKEAEQAVKYWKQVVRDFYKKSHGETRLAVDSLTTYYLREKKYSDYESWRCNETNMKDAKHRYYISNYAWNIAWRNYPKSFWGKYTKFNKKEKAKDMLAFIRYFKQQKTWYEKNKKMWDFYTRSLHFTVRFIGDKKLRDNEINQTIKYIDSLKDKKDRIGKYGWVVDRLRETGRHEQALNIARRIPERFSSMYKVYQVTGHGMGKWADAAKILQEMIKANDKIWSKRAQNDLAWVYMEHLRKYDDAIKLYQLISNPPHTLWPIKICYERKGDFKKALLTLNELENMFPDQAARAALDKVYLYKNNGDKKMAIKHAKRILKVYKKSGQASRAHQILEDFGIDVGGGDIND
ncbi:MAG: hypothetical protein HRT89_16315 [Lentisphaeria bacterium]|nr:hypothetical protein [Lentisphaeria bacterium]NQZ69624.1 hypothetical protein [Lentisphaeria bacterium]